MKNPCKKICLSILVIFWSVWSSVVLASDDLYLKGITIAGKKAEFKKNKGLDAFLSSNCFNENSNTNSNMCQAEEVARSLTQLDLIKFQEDFSNPGKGLCESKKGKIIRGKTFDQSEISFCQFEDRSLIGLNTLARIASLKTSGEKK